MAKSIPKAARERPFHQTVVPRESYHHSILLLLESYIFPKPPLSRSQFKEVVDLKDVGISIEYKGIHIHLEKHFDSMTLKKCLLVLMEIKC